MSFRFLLRRTAKETILHTHPAARGRRHRESLRELGFIRTVQHTYRFLRISYGIFPKCALPLLLHTIGNKNSVRIRRQLPNLLFLFLRTLTKYLSEDLFPMHTEYTDPFLIAYKTVRDDNTKKYTQENSGADHFFKRRFGISP